MYVCVCVGVGEGVAFYFAWMDYYSACIMVPAVVGGVMYVARGRHTTVDTDPYLPFYSVFMAMWAILYLVVSSVNRHAMDARVVYYCVCVCVCVCVHVCVCDLL